MAQLSQRGAAAPASALNTRVLIPTTLKYARPRSVARAVQCSSSNELQPINHPVTRRRDALLALGVSLPWLASSTQQAWAVQGLTAGRIPGLSSTPDSDGFFQYTRPEGKSGGHGVGWSEIPRYEFRVPPTWSEIPVSIADLGGTEIDLRYTSREQGEMAVVVAPIMRFADIGFNANVTIQMLGGPDKIIKGFGPELFGNPLEDEDLLETYTVEKNGLMYYSWRLKPFRLVTATATGNRIFILSLQSNARQWRKHEEELRKIAQSFVVPPARTA